MSYPEPENGPAQEEPTTHPEDVLDVWFSLSDDEEDLFDRLVVAYQAKTTSETSTDQLGLVAVDAVRQYITDHPDDQLDTGQVLTDWFPPDTGEPWCEPKSMLVANFEAESFEDSDADELARIAYTALTDRYLRWEAKKLAGLEP